MIKRIMILFFVLLMASVLFADETIWFKGTLEEAKVKAKQENKLLIIDFYSDG